jgi:hypothetical protein
MIASPSTTTPVGVQTIQGLVYAGRQLTTSQGHVLDLYLRKKRGLAMYARSPSFGVLDLAAGAWYTRGSMNA